MNKSLSEIAQLVNGTVVGNSDLRVTGLNGLKEAQPGDLSFFADPRYKSLLEDSKAVAILASSDFKANGIPVIQVDNPYFAFSALLKDYEREVLIHPSEVHPSATIAESATIGPGASIDANVRIEENCEIGENCVLYAGVYVGRNSTIGPDTIIYPNTTIRERCTLGARCIIHSNVAIGADGFGFALVNGVRAKIPQVGTVTIGDDVEIGSNTSVDRATTGTTTIGNGTKIDNLVQIGHNATIGEHCTISAITGIAGSAQIGNHVMIGGQAGVGGHLKVGDNSMIAARAGISKSVPPGSIVSGFPQNDVKVTRRILMSLPYLPKLLRRVRNLEEKVANLKEDTNG